MRAIDWITVVQDSDRWRALVNAVMYLRVPCTEFHDWRMSRASQEGLCSMQLDS